MKEIKECPHCGADMTVYKRQIRKNMLHCLRLLFFNFERQYKKTNEIEGRTVMISDFPKMRFWGLIEKHPDCDMWRITDTGIMFVLGRVQIPQFKWIYRNQVQTDPSDEINPLIWAWDIAPQEISKETVLRDARPYPITYTEQGDFFNEQMPIM